MAIVHVPYTVEQDEDGVWCAHAWLGSSGGANGNGATLEEAVEDLREAVRMVFDEEGNAWETYSGISTRVECPKTLRLRVLNRLGYLPNVAVGVFEVGRSHAPGLIRRPLEEVDAPSGHIGMEGINIVGEGG
jgi:predicted RNase H-like HicB family nuclease